MLPFVPRSVAGTKRIHPQGHSALVIPHVKAETSVPKDMRPVASVLLNQLSSWWAERQNSKRPDPKQEENPVFQAQSSTGTDKYNSLSTLILRATNQEVHVARILANEGLHVAGCKSSADMCAALAFLYPFHVIQVRFFYTHMQGHLLRISVGAMLFMLKSLHPWMFRSCLSYV